LNFDGSAKGECGDGHDNVAHSNVEVTANDQICGNEEQPARRDVSAETWRKSKNRKANGDFDHADNCHECTQVTEFNPAGGVVAQQSLPELDFRRPINWYEVTGESLVTPITARAGIDVIATIRKEPVYGSRNGTVRRLGWILPAMAGLICAVIAFLRTRSYAFPSKRVLTWTLFAFATGPFGLLTMLMLLEWPARETCPACGKPRVVTSERCEHCSQPFAPPTADGTEIFETA
jgi:hypothetical protein